MTTPYLYLHTPEIIFAARVDMPTVSYPVTEVVYDGVTTGAYTEIEIDMTLLIGTSAGADDLGRVRVQGTPTSTRIPVGRISEGTYDGQLSIEDNAYLTVLLDFRVWAKAPYIDPDTGVQYKDSDIVVDERTGADTPPVANCGPGFAATIDDDDVITVYLNGANSFAVADGATITAYAWDIVDGNVIVGDTDEDDLTVTFPAGFRWVKLTVLDSNGNTHTARCPVLAVDPDDDVTFHDFNATIRTTQTGQEATFTIVEDVPRATYPDGTLILFVTDEPSEPQDRTHMAFIGWEQTANTDVRATRTGTIPGLTLSAVDVAGRLSSLPGFPQEIESNDSPANWTDMVSPTMDKYIHYLLHWHSTALALADYFPSGTGSDYPFVIFHSDGENLFDQVNDQAKRLLPDHLLTCNINGQLAVNQHPFYLDEDDRPVTVQGTFTEDYIESIQYGYTRPPKTHWVRGHAMLTQDDYTDVDGTPTLLTAHCIAPGTSPGQGVNELTTSEGLVPSQSILNSVTGHRYARINSVFGQVTIATADDAFTGIDPADLEWVNIQIVEDANAGQRGFTFDNIRTLCSEISRRYEARRTGTVIKGSYTLEIETVGRPALTVIPEGTPYTLPDDPDDLVTTPPDMGLIEGQGLMAGIGKFKLYRTADFDTPSGSGGPTWEAIDLTGAEEIMTWVVNPFSDGYLDGTGTINGFIATNAHIYKVNDLFGTVTVDTLVTFANTASWRTIQASFGAYQPDREDNPWLICVSYYGSTGGHTGTWATYSTDGGVTWASEVQVSALYDSGGAVNPIGLYCSPKTPGLAYTIAHNETANPADSSGFVSVDWGATWSEVTATEDPVEILPAFGKWDDDTDGSYSYIGPQPSATLTSTATSTGSIVQAYKLLGIHPPADCVRMIVHVEWSNISTSDGGVGSQGSGLDINNGTGVSRTGSNNYTQATINGGELSGSFDLEFTFVGVDWPQNRELVEVTPPATRSGTRFRIRPAADAVAGHTREVTETITVTITEIELDGGAIYTPVTPGLFVPVHGMGGEIHLPWEDNDSENVIYYGALDRATNRQFALMRAVAGTVDDISPNDGAKDYGVNAGHFSVRAHDSDRDLVLAAVSGNDATTSAANDKQGVYFSDDAGDTWTEIVTPATGTEVYQAAFSGSLDDVVYIWGPAAYFGYSEDNGATIDSRAGNLSALSATKIIGVAGGPSA